MKFKSNQTAMFLNKKWNSIDSNLKNTTSIIGGKAVIMPIILRPEDINNIINDNTIVDEALLHIRKEFSNMILTSKSVFNRKYIPDQDAYVISPYICIWISDLNTINRLMLIEIKDIATINSFINH